MIHQRPIDTLTFLWGERRRVYLSVRLWTGQAFSITSATWELLYCGAVEASGICDITPEEDRNGFILAVVIQPTKRQKYTLRFTYVLGDEIRKAEAYIIVD